MWNSGSTPRTWLTPGSHHPPGGPTASPTGPLIVEAYLLIGLLQITCRVRRRDPRPECSRFRGLSTTPAPPIRVRCRNDGPMVFPRVGGQRFSSPPFYTMSRCVAMDSTPGFERTGENSVPSVLGFHGLSTTPAPPYRDA